MKHSLNFQIVAFPVLFLLILVACGESPKTEKPEKLQQELAIPGTAYKARYQINDTVDSTNFAKLLVEKSTKDAVIEPGPSITVRNEGETYHLVNYIERIPALRGQFSDYLIIVKEDNGDYIKMLQENLGEYSEVNSDTGPLIHNIITVDNSDFVVYEREAGRGHFKQYRIYSLSELPPRKYELPHYSYSTDPFDVFDDNLESLSSNEGEYSFAKNGIAYTTTVKAEGNDCRACPDIAKITFEYSIDKGKFTISNAKRTSIR